MSSEPTFESAQRELEQIVQRLESGATELDEAIALWERGEGKIEQLATRVGAAKP